MHFLLKELIRFVAYFILLNLALIYLVGNSVSLSIIITFFTWLISFVPKFIKYYKVNKNNKG